MLNLIPPLPICAMCLFWNQCHSFVLRSSEKKEKQKNVRLGEDKDFQTEAVQN